MFYKNKTSLLFLIITILSINFSCQGIKSDEKLEKEIDEPFVSNNPYQYTIDSGELEEAKLYFDFEENFGAKGSLTTKNNTQKFNIKPVMPFGGYVSLKIIKIGTQTNDLTYYDYLINFEYKNLGKDQIKASFYDKNTTVRTDVLLLKIQETKK
jgi:hypothetical protein